jgi:hypothetical protein
MRRGLWLFLSSGGRVLGHPGIAAEFAMADDANRSMAAPAIGNRSSAESIYVAGAAGIRRTTATPGTGAAAIPTTVSIERSDPRLAGASCCDAESKASKPANHLAHAGTPAREFGCPATRRAGA